MIDFQQARRQMVDCQIRPNDITDLDIIDAFSAVPREAFVPQNKKEIAYIDKDLMISAGDSPSEERFLMQATPFAKLVKAAAIKPSDLVLCVACGCGYGAAIIAKLADSVVAIDENQSLVDHASDTANELGIDNLAIIRGDLEKGCPSEAPFDVIFIEGAIIAQPESLFGQLRDGGRLVTVMGEGLSSEVCLYLKQGSDISLIKSGNVSVPRLAAFNINKKFIF
ncbi:MAG: protein-L-isoaspartate O-methyltransferase [Hyphomicrobiales bacterium]